MERRGLGEAQEKRQVGIIRPGGLSAESWSAINIPGPCRQGEQQPYLSVALCKHHPPAAVSTANKSLRDALFVFQREWILQMWRKVDLGNVVVFPRFNLNRPSPAEW